MLADASLGHVTSETAAPPPGGGGPPDLGTGPVLVDTCWGFSEMSLERTRGGSCWGWSFPLGPKFLTLAFYWSLATPGRGAVQSDWT